MENLEYQIIKIGTLKYSRLKSLCILRSEINSYGYDYSILEIRELFNPIMDNRLDMNFSLIFKTSLDKIFDDNEYLEFNNYPTEQNFVNNWIPPIGGNYMKLGDTVCFCIDDENYVGVIKRINNKTADVLIFTGLINNIPISELNLK